ncbi:hypothetical protein OH492_18110 [Vibrio chagasii]|nr:hypothetical protein [Vibrio chagasii]
MKILAAYNIYGGSYQLAGGLVWQAVESECRGRVGGWCPEMSLRLGLMRLPINADRLAVGKKIYVYLEGHRVTRTAMY